MSPLDGVDIYRETMLFSSSMTTTDRSIIYWGRGLAT
jgi:hypothetical protein